MIVVSGGQTGIDRAALDAAKAFGYAAAGCCPLGRRAEDGMIAQSYPLQETTTAFYVHRTRLNVRDSDATLVLALNELRGGTALAVYFARRMGKPCHIVDLAAEPRPARSTLMWLDTHQPSRLNIGGPRASQGDNAYARGFQFCEALLSAAYSGRRV
ncbi:MAG: putative molybdenum carrier protein [Bacteroidota bacterium]